VRKLIEEKISRWLAHLECLQASSVLALYGLQAHHEMVGNALEIDCLWDEASSTPQNRPARSTMSITSKPYDAAWGLAIARLGIAWKRPRYALVRRAST